MIWFLLFVSLSSCEKVCNESVWRCEVRCGEKHTVGSAEHLQCKYRCWENKLFCLEGCQC